jgi:hypothetical protein
MKLIQILNMLTETRLRIPFIVIGCSENASKCSSTGGFQYYFTGSQAASYMHFQCQNHRFRAPEEGYWYYFQKFL